MITDHKQAVAELERKYDTLDESWTQVSADIAIYFLNVLPPIFRSGGFACSEQYSDRNGRPTYFCFREAEDADYVGRICTLNELEAAGKG